jgi:hypothetical protein
MVLTRFFSEKVTYILDLTVGKEVAVQRFRRYGKCKGPETGRRPV